MKTALGVSRCCCKKQLFCEPTVTNWFDDFASYTSGQDLISSGIGYRTDGDFTFLESNGQGRLSFEDSGGQVSSRIVYREVAAHPISYDLWDFELELSTAPDKGTIFLWNRFLFSPLTIQMYWNKGGAIGGGNAFNCVTVFPNGSTTNESSHGLLVSDGDILRIRAEKIQYSRQSGILEVMVYFYQNGSLITSRKSWHSPFGQTAWCFLEHGFFSPVVRSTNFIDNWNFYVDGFFIQYSENWLSIDTSTAVSAVVTIRGGEAAFTYSVLSGALPSGLSLNASSGLISGTPTTSPEVGSFVIRCTDSNGTIADSPEYSFDVAVGA